MTTLRLHLNLMNLPSKVDLPKRRYADRPTLAPEGLGSTDVHFNRCVCCFSLVHAHAYFLQSRVELLSRGRPSIVEEPKCGFKWPLRLASGKGSF